MAAAGYDRIASVQHDVKTAFNLTGNWIDGDGEYKTALDGQKPNTYVRLPRAALQNRPPPFDSLIPVPTLFSFCFRGSAKDGPHCLVICQVTEDAAKPIFQTKVRPCMAHCAALAHLSSSHLSYIAPAVHGRQQAAH
jgi:hypothetical protein